MWRHEEFEKKYEYCKTESKGNSTIEVKKYNIQNFWKIIRKYHIRLDKEEDRISELEDSAIEIILTGTQRETKVEKQQSFNDLWDSV